MPGPLPASPCLARALAGAALIAVLCGGCTPRVDEVPESARGQTPRSAPNAPWQAKGRLEVNVPITGMRISCTVILRGMGDGSTRAVFLSDEGITLADITAAAGTYPVTKSLPAFSEALPRLGRLVAQAYAAPTTEVRSWDDGRLVALADGESRWYGGDPLLLRLVRGQGFDIYLEDYRQLGGELLPWEVRGEGPLGITVRIRLQEARAAKGAGAALSAPDVR